MTLGRRLPLLVASGFVLFSAAASAQLISSTSPCDALLWNHVYHPARLRQIRPCIRVSGTIVLERPEKDS